MEVGESELVSEDVESDSTSPVSRASTTDQVPWPAAALLSKEAICNKRCQVSVILKCAYSASAFAAQLGNFNSILVAYLSFLLSPMSDLFRHCNFPFPLQCRTLLRKKQRKPFTGRLATEILESLLEEDDEVVQVWYLLGWVCYLQVEKPEETEAFKDSARTYLTKAKKCHCFIPQTRPPECTTKPDLKGRAVSQGPPLSHSERGKAHTPSSPPLHVIAMTDRRIPRDCCPPPAVIRMCQIVSPDLSCYRTSC
ncbi:UNVERIFIED_CONTAM: hypothetical protein FKN15_044907 [Acipenser sinensis]